MESVHDIVSVNKTKISIRINDVVNTVFKFKRMHDVEVSSFDLTLQRQTQSKEKQVLTTDMISIIAAYVQENKDVLNLALVNKRNKDRILEFRKHDAVDPVRHFLKIVSPHLLIYLDGTTLEGFLPYQKRKLFDDVQEIFTPKKVVDSTNIASTLQDHAADLYVYIKNNQQYDPEIHYELYEKYVHKMQSENKAHQGFAVKYEEGLPLGTYYAEHHCSNYLYGNSEPGGSSLQECVEKCKRNLNCTACTISSSFHLLKMIMKPSQCELGPRATFTKMGVWIKDKDSKKSQCNNKNTKLQEYARCNRDVSRLISEYKIEGYAL
jgi:hypothetical protein